MDQLSNFISEYLKTCETVQKLNSKTIKAYRIDLKTAVINGAIINNLLKKVLLNFKCSDLRYFILLHFLSVFFSQYP